VSFDLSYSLEPLHAFREYLTIVSNTDARPAAEAQAPTEVYTYSVRKAKRKFRVKVHGWDAA
jgi:hypothetical protein